MKKMKQFEDAALELILFGFDVLTTSGESEGPGGQGNSVETLERDTNSAYSAYENPVNW